MKLHRITHFAVRGLKLVRPVRLIRPVLALGAALLLTLCLSTASSAQGGQQRRPAPAVGPEKLPEEPVNQKQIMALKDSLQKAHEEIKALRGVKTQAPLSMTIWLSGVTLMALGLGGGFAWMFLTQKKAVASGTGATPAPEPVLTISGGWAGFTDVQPKISQVMMTMRNERKNLPRIKNSMWEAWNSSLTSSFATVRTVTLSSADAGSLKSLARTIREHAAVITSVPKAKAAWTGSDVQKTVDDFLRWCDQKAEELAKTSSGAHARMEAAASQNPNAGYGELIKELEGIQTSIRAVEAKLKEHDTDLDRISKWTEVCSGSISELRSDLTKLEAKVDQNGSMGAMLEAEFARQCTQRAQELQKNIDARKRTLTQAPPPVVAMALKAAGDAALLGAQATMDSMLAPNVRTQLSRLGSTGSEIESSNPLASVSAAAAPSVAAIANLANEPQVKWSADLLSRGSLERAQSAYWSHVNKLLEERVRPVQEWLDNTAGGGDDSSELRVRDWLVSRVLPFLNAARLVLQPNGDVQHEVRTRGNQTVRTAMQSLDSSFRHLLQGAGGLFEVEHAVGQAVSPGPRVTLEEGDRGKPAGTILEVRETAILWGEHLLRPARLLVQQETVRTAASGTEYTAPAPGPQPGPEPPSNPSDPYPIAAPVTFNRPPLESDLKPAEQDVTTPPPAPDPGTVTPRRVSI